MTIQAVILLLALILFAARKPLARAIKKYFARKRAQAAKWAKALAKQQASAAKVAIARRTIGGLA